MNLYGVETVLNPAEPLKLKGFCLTGTLPTSSHHEMLTHWEELFVNCPGG